MNAGLVYPIGPNSASNWSGNATSSAPMDQLSTKVPTKKARTDAGVRGPRRVGAIGARPERATAVLCVMTAPFEFLHC